MPEEYSDTHTRTHTQTSPPCGLYCSGVSQSTLRTHTHTHTHIHTQSKLRTVSELRETKVRQGRFIYIEPSVHCGHSKCFTDEKKWCVCVFVCVCVRPVVFSLDFMAGVTCILSGSVQCGSSAVCYCVYEFTHNN